MSLRPFLILFFALAAEAQTSKRYAVLPFVALTGDVPAKAAEKVTAMLSNELSRQDGIERVDAGTMNASAPSAEIQKARAEAKRAAALRAQKKFTEAQAAAGQALSIFVSLASEVTARELSDAYALSSAILYSTGQDEEGLRALDAAINLSPEAPLPLAETSKLFSGVISAEQKRIATSAVSSFKVKSVPSGGRVIVDGVALGSTPLDVQNIPPGTHLWQVDLPSLGRVGNQIAIVPGKTLEFTAQSTPVDPASQVAWRLAQNRVDADAVKFAKEFATTAHVDVLLLGALSRKGNNLLFDSFSFSHGSLRRLPRKQFDSDLLSAGVELFSLAGALAKDGASLGEPVKLPQTASLEPLDENGFVQATYPLQRNAPTGGQPTDVVPEIKKRIPLRKK